MAPQRTPAKIVARGERGLRVRSGITGGYAGDDHHLRFGLVIYDEVHLLPAPVFRLTAEHQARRRLGLTATLVREDGRAGDVWALVGPKRYDVPWRELEASGHIARASCFETRVPLDESLREAYALAEPREQLRIAADNPLKLRVLAEIAERHGGDRVLVLGSYLGSLAAAGALLSAPVITGGDAAPRAGANLRGFSAGTDPAFGPVPGWKFPEVEADRLGTKLARDVEVLKRAG